MYFGVQDVATTNDVLICTFRELAYSLKVIHQWRKADVDRLHDVWKRGAPTPDSIVRNPKGYDPRKNQPGNVEKRIVIPNALSEWVADTATRHGQAISPTDAVQLVIAVQKGRAKAQLMAKLAAKRPKNHMR